MGYKERILKAVAEMTERECENLWNYIPKIHKAIDKKKNCNHSMRYDMKTGGSTCTLCNWMS